MIRTYLKAIFMLCAVYQTTESMNWNTLSTGVVAAPISAFIVAGIAYSVSDMGHPYTGWYLVGIGSVLAAFRPLSKYQFMPLYCIKDEPIFKNYQFYFSAALLISGLVLLAYQNRLTGSSSTP